MPVLVRSMAKAARRNTWQYNQAIGTSNTIVPILVAAPGTRWRLTKLMFRITTGFSNNSQAVKLGYLGSDAYFMTSQVLANQAAGALVFGPSSFAQTIIDGNSDTANHMIMTLTLAGGTGTGYISCEFEAVDDPVPGDNLPYGA